MEYIPFTPDFPTVESMEIIYVRENVGVIFESLKK
jgi:hypothetical protein